MSNPVASLRVHPVPALSDNYIWLIECPASPGSLVAVDPGDAAPVIAALKRLDASLAAILLTHHHPDHIGGVGELRRHWPAAVIGPDDTRIDSRTRTVREGERCDLPDLGLSFEILEIPGHTLSHIAFWGHGALFCGDTLFSAGCGRMFEGTPTQMNASLDRLKALPPETFIYCGHEYTAANVKFALTVEPANARTQAYREHIAKLREAGHPSLPSTLGLEIDVNPFLRCELASVRAAATTHAGRGLSAPAEVFAVLRGWKDQFR